MKGFATGIFLLTAHMVFGQGPDFTAPASACLQENLVLVNTSAGTVSNEWDFCEGDLSVQPFFTPIGTVGTASIALDIRSVEDNGHFYSFVCSAGTDRIIRMDFSSDPRNPTPVSTEIDPGVAVPTGIDVFKNADQWYGIVGTFTDPANISLLNFGNSLANAPSINPVTLSGPPQPRVVRAIRSVNEGSTTIVFFANSNDASVTRVVLDPAMDGSVVSADNIAIPGATSMFAISLLSTGGNKFMIATDVNNGNIYKVAFGNSFANPAASVVPQTLPQPVVNPTGIELAADDGLIVGLLLTQSGQFFRLTWPMDMVSDSPTQVQLTGININDGVRGLSLIRSSGHYYAYFTNYLYSIIGRLDFEKNCSDVDTQLSAEESPPDVQYSEPGNYTITLRGKTTSGSTEFVSKTVTVSGLIAPEVTIANDGMCAASSVNFSTPGFAEGTWSWDLGNGDTSTSDSPASVYATAGTYTVDLSVVASNGCGNHTTAPVKIYDKPVAAFTTPTGLICTNNEFSFNNGTVDDFDGNLLYEWSIDDDVVGSARDLKYTFTAPGDHDATLKVSIPGCSDVLTKTVNDVNTGPVVGFTFTGKCEGDSFIFTNTSTGDIANYSWTFGDGNASTDTDPSNEYSAHGSYTVTLSTTGNNGCVSTTGKPVDVYSTPKPTFSIDLPPFSCSGTPSQFHDATPAMSDSNVQTWDWTFGDSGAGTGKDPVHIYSTSGVYTVTLSVATDKGCAASTEHEVTIAQSPVADFDISPACAAKSTQFSDTSTGDVVSWQWKTGNSMYTSQNASHVFAASGDYSMTLTITGSNDCTSTLSKPVVVPIVPVVDFDVRNQCSGQLAIFTSLTENAGDPIIEQTWNFDTEIRSGQETEFAFLDAGTYAVQLQVQSESGCVYSTAKQVVINQSPVASFTMSDQSGPPPLKVLFTNTSTGASSYQWDFNDGSQPSTEASPQHTYSTLGNYVAELTAISAEGCGSAISNVVSVIVPVNELALEEFSLLMPAGGSAYRGYVRVHNNGNYRVQSFNVSYNIGGGIELRETVSASLMAGETKTFLLSNQFVGAGSTAFVCAELDNDSNPDDNKACTSLTGSPVVFSPNPNPADAFLNIETVNVAAGVVRVRMYDMTGGQAYDRSFDVGEGLSRLSLDIQNLSPGMYVVVVSSANVSSSQKILIAR